jgi:hypothetical protein
MNHLRYFTRQSLFDLIGKFERILFDLIGKFERILFDLIGKSQFALLFSSSTPVVRRRAWATGQRYIG